ncbi:SDR family oxidoreductase [Shouchella sp. 1P09AA]|uniref:SDR family NAD(P)-dependent oxidoreductase n=1 Tax=unclassified Shouchella TaxID=2893065 RepID=UPI0039A2A101
MSLFLEGQAGLVTAAGSGIGRASALAFARAGANVMVSDINEEAGKETLQRIKADGGTADFFLCNVSEESQVKALVDYTVETFGRLDFAHNNAGKGTMTRPIQDSDSEDFESAIDITVNGMYYALKYEVMAMIKTGGGAIVNTSSGAGLHGPPNMVGHAAAKWAVNGMTKALAVETGQYGIRVNSICPGMTLTPAVEQTPEDQAEAAVWLCSPMAKHISGINMPVDGGYVAGK